MAADPIIQLGQDSDILLFRSIHYNLDDFNDEELAVHESTPVEFFVRKPLFARNSRTPKETTDLLRNRTLEADDSEAIARAMKTRETFLSLPDKTVALRKHQYPLRDAVFQCYWHRFDKFDKELSSQYALRGNAGVIHDELASLAQNQENFLLSTTTSLLNALIHAYGIMNPKRAEVRASRYDSDLLPDTRILGRVFVIRVPLLSLRKLNQESVLFVKSQLVQEKRVRLNSRVAFGEEVAWLGMIPGEFVVGCFDVPAFRPDMFPAPLSGWPKKWFDELHTGGDKAYLTTIERMLRSAGVREWFLERCRSAWLDLRADHWNGFSLASSLDPAADSTKGPTCTYGTLDYWRELRKCFETDLSEIKTYVPEGHWISYTTDWLYSDHRSYPDQESTPKEPLSWIVQPHRVSLPAAVAEDRRVALVTTHPRVSREAHIRVPLVLAVDSSSVILEAVLDSGAPCVMLNWPSNLVMNSMPTPTVAYGIASRAVCVITVSCNMNIFPRSPDIACYCQFYVSRALREALFFVDWSHVDAAGAEMVDQGLPLAGLNLMEHFSVRFETDPRTGQFGAQIETKPTWG